VCSNTFSPDDVSHLYNFGNLVGNQAWHVQNEFAFVYVCNYSYHSVVIVSTVHYCVMSELFCSVCSKVFNHIQ
jgi:hypothetical protein